MTWISGDEGAKWTQIEQGEIKGAELSALPFLDPKQFNKLKIGNEWVSLLKFGQRLKKKKNLRDYGSISRAMPITGNPDFPPSIGDGEFKGWATKGLKFLNQLFEEAHLKSFSQLQEQFDVPSNVFYRYLQIRHYIKTHKENERLWRTPNAIGSSKSDFFILPWLYLILLRTRRQLYAGETVVK